MPLTMSKRAACAHRVGHRHPGSRQARQQGEHDHEGGNGHHADGAGSAVVAGAKEVGYTPGFGLGTVGNHLQVLLSAGLVLRRRSGREVIYWRSAVADALVASANSPPARQPYEGLTATFAPPAWLRRWATPIGSRDIEDSVRRGGVTHVGVCRIAA